MDETSTTALFSCIEAQLTIVQRLIDRILQHGIEYGSGDPKSSPVQLLAELKTLQLCLLRVEKISVSEDFLKQIIQVFVSLFPGVFQVRLDQHTQPCTGSEAGSDDDISEHGFKMEKDDKCRLVYLACLQTLIKINPKLFHGTWRTLLSDDPINVGLSEVKERIATLTYILVYEQNSRVRHAAAASISTLLEGPAQRAYMSIAEMPSQQIRGFVPLSQSLGQMIMATLDTLGSCIEREMDELCCCAMIRALTMIVVGISWGRFPAGLLVKQIQVLRDKIDPNKYIKTGSSSVVQHSLSSLSTIFSVKLTRAAEDAFRDTLAAGHVYFDDLLQTLQYWIKNNRCMIRYEAVSAMRGLLRKTPSECRHLLMHNFSSIVEQVQSHMADDMESDKGFAEKALQETLYLIGDIVKNANEDVHCQIQCISDAVEHCLLPALAHRSSKIQAAGFSSIAMIPGIYWKSSSQKRSYACVQQALNTCSQGSRKDSIVQAAGLRALLSILATIFPDNLTSYTCWNTLVEVVQTSMRNPVLGVRVQGSNIIKQLAKNLWEISMEDIKHWKDIETKLSEIVDFLVQHSPPASTDHDKIKPNGILCAGYMLSLRIRTTPIYIWGDDSAIRKLVQCLVLSFDQSLLSAQWAACEASKIVFLTVGVTFVTLTSDSKNLLDSVCLNPINEALKRLYDESKKESRTWAVARESLEAFDSCQPRVIQNDF